MTAEQIASRAAELVNGDRERTHGDKQTNFDNIACLWSAWFQINEERCTELTGSDVAKLMALLKIARMQSGEYSTDDFIDCAGYAAIAGELSAPRGGEGK